MTTQADSLAAAREKIDHIGGPTTEYEIDCLISVVGHLADAIEAGPDNGLTAAQKQVVSDGRKAAEKREKALAEARREGVMKGCTWAAEQVSVAQSFTFLSDLVETIRRGPQPDAAPIPCENRDDQAESWIRVFNLCRSLGMDSDSGSGSEMVESFITKIGTKPTLPLAKMLADADEIERRATGAHMNGAGLIFMVMRLCANVRTLVAALEGK